VCEAQKAAEIKLEEDNATGSPSKNASKKKASGKGTFLPLEDIPQMLILQETMGSRSVGILSHACFRRSSSDSHSTGSILGNMLGCEHQWISTMVFLVFFMNVFKWPLPVGKFLTSTPLNYGVGDGIERYEIE
jgi:hypothetical protein